MQQSPFSYVGSQVAVQLIAMSHSFYLASFISLLLFTTLFSFINSTLLIHWLTLRSCVHSQGSTMLGKLRKMAGKMEAVGKVVQIRRQWLQGSSGIVELLYFGTYLHRNTTYPFPLLTLTYLYLKWGVFLTPGCKCPGKVRFRQHLDHSPLSPLILYKHHKWET